VEFAVDTKAPAGAAPLAGPPASSSASTQTFAFAGEPGATFLCALDDEPLAPCTSPVTRTGLTVGQHRFRVVQVDAAGNRSAEQITAFEITKIAASSEKQDTAKAARAMLGRGGRSIVTLGRLTIGCATDQGPLSACGGQVVDGKGVVLARGAVKATGGATSVALTLFRTQEGRNALRRQPLGVKAFIELALTTPTGRTLTTRTPTTLVASNQIVMLNGRAGKLTQTTRTQLTELAKTFRTGTKVSCVAHVDKRASAARDRKITTAQAQSACALIKQLAPKIVTTAKGLGHSVPRATNRSAAGRTRNQRMVITFTL
jgi:outer membrane protein OmpA-like peptidoglycan-associated protein